LFIINQGLWKQTVETLVLVVAASAASMAVGVPLGIWAAHKPNVYRIMLPILDLMQTLPTFVYSSRCLRCLALATRRVSS
jgi:glycine betaine/proline transport system permease protein